MGSSNEQVTLSWNAVDYGYTYDIQIDDVSSFSSPIYTYTSEIGATYIKAHTLPNGKWYFRVRARNVNGVAGYWSSPRYFMVYTSFELSFNTNSSEGWIKNSGGTWNLGDGKLYNTGLLDSKTSSVYYSNGIITDSTVEVIMKVDEKIEGGEFGIILRGNSYRYDSYYDWLNGYYIYATQEYEASYSRYYSCVESEKN